MDAGQLEAAAAFLAEAEAIGAQYDVVCQWPSHTVRGDFALVSGNPVEAVEHYARSLEGTDRDGAMFQIRVDLITMADALAMCARDEPALEVAGIVEGLDDDFGFPPEAQWHFQGRNYVAEAAGAPGLGSRRAGPRRRAGGTGQRSSRTRLRPGSDTSQRQPANPDLLGLPI